MSVKWTLLAFYVTSYKFVCEEILRPRCRYTISHIYPYYSSHLIHIMKLLFPSLLCTRKRQFIPLWSPYCDEKWQASIISDIKTSAKASIGLSVVEAMYIRYVMIVIVILIKHLVPNIRQSSMSTILPTKNAVAQAWGGRMHGIWLHIVNHVISATGRYHHNFIVKRYMTVKPYDNLQKIQRLQCRFHTSRNPCLLLFLMQTILGWMNL